MTCPDEITLLTWVDEGRSTDSPIADHLSTCPSCQERLARRQQLKALIAQSWPALGREPGQSCPGPESLLAYAEDDQAKSDSIDIGRHLASCDRCFSLLADARRALAEAAEPTPLVPAKLLSRGKSLIARWSPRSRRTVTWRRAGFAFAGAAVSFAAIFLGLRKHHPALQVPAPRPPSVTRPTVVAGEPGAVAPRLDLFDRIAFRYRRHGASQATEVVLPSHEPVSLSSRDDYALSLRPRADGWLYVYQIDASRRVRQLFPNAGFGTKSNPVNAYQDYLLPSSGAWYYLDETVGPETIYVVFSTTERADLDAASTGPEAAERLTAEINRMFALSDHRRVGYMTFRFQHQ